MTHPERATIHNTRHITEPIYCLISSREKYRTENGRGQVGVLMRREKVAEAAIQNVTEWSEQKSHVPRQLMYFFNCILSRALDCGDSRTRVCVFFLYSPIAKIDHHRHSRTSSALASTPHSRRTPADACSAHPAAAHPLSTPPSRYQSCATHLGVDRDDIMRIPKHLDEELLAALNRNDVGGSEAGDPHVA